jgi:hypothetical protein
MPDGHQIALRVRRSLEQIPDTARRLGISATGGWTVLIKEQLARLGDEMDYAVCTSGAVRANPQGQPWPDWLYDLTWLKMVDGGKHLARVPLVLEAEWHSHRGEQIDADFQELLLARADLRVMVFQQRKASAVQTVMDDLERQAKAFEATGSGDLYLLCGYDWEDTRRFAFRTFAT